jgi:hypothetical protein
MKKFTFLFLFVLVLLASTNAYALQCKMGNFGSDECWTTAQMTTNDGAVTAGTVMVYDFTSVGNGADEAAWQVVRSTSSDQRAFVAGVVQQTTVSGDRVQLLVRGKGKLKTITETTVASGDRIYLWGGTTQQHLRGTGSNKGSDIPSAASRDDAIAFALTTASASSTIDAYITLI